MKYYLFKKGMALYKEKEDSYHRYVDYFPEPKEENRELLLLSHKDMKKEQDYLDRHVGEYGWEIKRFKEDESNDKQF